ncbi:hypothetical protein CPLU01_02172 [Colletotrichum plurivorum]|uniref:Uncharacterized protein n=1 Tax=Colletotrichum plurivorum TaxID=2175906 RepID=A0A8H6KWD1_9PEZI|nr:hypothetical protein CPLU01_02172 [Colletotrichum plurivorum]
MRTTNMQPQMLDLRRRGAEAHREGRTKAFLSTSHAAWLHNLETTTATWTWLFFERDKIGQGAEWIGIPLAKGQRQTRPGREGNGINQTKYHIPTRIAVQTSIALHPGPGRKLQIQISVWASHLDSPRRALPQPSVSSVLPSSSGAWASVVCCVASAFTGALMPLDAATPIRMAVRHPPLTTQHCPAHSLPQAVLCPFPPYSNPPCASQTMYVVTVSSTSWFLVHGIFLFDQMPSEAHSCASDRTTTSTYSILSVLHTVPVQSTQSCVCVRSPRAISNSWMRMRPHPNVDLHNSPLIPATDSVATCASSRAGILRGGGVFGRFNR